mgnify:CR=1 FL=1
MQEAIKEPKELKIEDDAVIVEEEGFDVVDGEGNNSFRIKIEIHYKKICSHTDFITDTHCIASKYT